jgi:hypothetical protein
MYLASLLLLLSASIVFGQNELSPQERKDGFQLLFDGKTLDNWHTLKRRPNNASWTVDKGVLSYEKGESTLATNDNYYDFVLRLDYRTAAKTDSGVYIHATPAGSPGTTGIELNLISDAGAPAGPHTSGSLGTLVAPSKNMGKPDGEWNSIEVTVVNGRLTEVWNGEKVLEVSFDDPQYPKLAERGPYGFIGLQAHAFGEPAEFRNIRVKALKLGPPFPP